MEARKLLINLLYRATSQSSELPGWSHRETKKGERLKSPCINICEFDADVCRGCGRTRQEIRAWKRADKAEQRLILAEADLRLLALQARGRRKFR